MVASFPESDCARFFAPRFSSSSSIQHAACFASDTSSSNLSCSSSTSDTSSGSSSARRSSWESKISASAIRNSGKNKPHQAEDAAWNVLRSLKLKDGSIGLAHFKPLRKVGRGDIGSVYLAQLRGCTGCLFAIKIMDKHALTHRNKVQRMHVEKQILELVDHPFLPTLYAHFETEQFSCLVTEFCPGGDLHALRQRQSGGKRFGVKAVRFYAAEVLVALEYLHMLGVVYRDLKPENVLVRDDGHIMLTDFDLCLKGDVEPKLLLSSSSSSSSSNSSGRRRNLLRQSSSHSSSTRRVLLRLSSKSTSSTSSSQQMLSASDNSDRSITGSLISCFLFPRKILHHNQRQDQPKTHDHQNPSKQSGAAADPRSDSTHKPTNSPHEFTFPELIAEPTQARSMSFVGTHEYLAPEIIAGCGHGNAVDWWTLGIFLFELLFGRTPFKGSSNDQTLTNIMRQHLRFPEEAEYLEAGEEAKNLIQRLLMKDPRKRLGSFRGAAEIKQHPFFRGINWPLIRCAKPPEIPARIIIRASVDQKLHKARKNQQTIVKPKRWSINKMISDLIPQFQYF